MKMAMCVLCNVTATTACRGTIEKIYVSFCSFHAGAIQMILEQLKVANNVKWKPLFKKPIERKDI